MPSYDDFGKRTAPAEVTLVRVLPAPVERVWSYLTDSGKRGRWLASGVLEPRVGGTIELNFLHANLSEEKTPPAKYAAMAAGHRMTGKVTKYEPPRVLAYTWEGEDELSEVTFTLAPEGAGRTRLVIRHAKLGNAEMERSVAAGWHVHVAILLAELEGAKPPPFWSTHAKLENEYARVLAE